MKSLKSIVLILFILAAQPLWAARMHETVRKAIPVNGIKKIRIHTTNGRVVVTPHKAKTIVIVAHKKIDGSGRSGSELLKSIEVITDVQKGTLNVSAKIPHKQRHGLMSWLLGAGLKNFSIDWEIQAPSTVPIEVESTNGNVEVDDWAAPLNIITTNGDIEVLRVSQTVEAYSTNGNIHVYCKHMPVRGAIRLSTTNGKIDLILPKQAACTISAYSNNGEIVCDLPGMEQTERTERMLKAVVAGGGTKIDVQTTNGDITITNK